MHEKVLERLFIGLFTNKRKRRGKEVEFFPTTKPY